MRTAVTDFSGRGRCGQGLRKTVFPATLRVFKSRMRDHPNPNVVGLESDHVWQRRLIKRSPCAKFLQLPRESPTMSPAPKKG